MLPGRDGRMARYLRTNEKVWTPPHIITIDSESWRTQRPGGEDQTLRLWCARLDDRRRPEKRASQQLRARGTTGPQLAGVIDDWCRGRETIWLYAHNLGYDLTTTQLVENLADTGWELDRCSTIPEYLFLFMSKGRKRLTITDLHHLLPMRLADIGAMIDLGKLPTPRPDAPEDDWFRYCGRDVDVAAEALLAMMAHGDDYQLGNWSVSGAGCGFRAMRHTIPAKSITLIQDQDASNLARAAIYGGKRYCWRHGPQPPGRYIELDFTAAHATCGASYPLPVKAGAWFDQLDPHHMAVDGRLAVVIAECEVETDVPRFPCRIGGRVWYPVGRFRTTLASPEIAWARDLGCLRSIGRGQFHYTSGAMTPFFKRVLDIGHPRNETHPPVIRAMWKQWGRSVIGKFAQRGYDVKRTNMLTDKVWHYEKAQDWETGEEYWLVHFGGYIHEARPAGDGSNAYPAVLALVESYERVALGRTADLLGPASLIQCDTDGIWVDAGALESGAPTGLGFRLADNVREVRIPLAIDVVNAQLGALQLREKHTVGRIAIWGPQNYDAGPYTRQAGRPSGLREVQDGVWAGDTFPSIAHQMTHADAGTYRLEQVTWTRPVNVIPGWVLASGTVRAVEAITTSQGGNALQAWPATRWARGGDQLGPAQHEALSGLWTPDAEDDSDAQAAQADQGHQHYGPGGEPDSRPSQGQPAPAQT